MMRTIKCLNLTFNISINNTSMPVEKNIALLIYGCAINTSIINTTTANVPSRVTY